MVDPYLYPGTSVLKNKLGIRKQETLDGAESNYSAMRLKELQKNPLSGSYDFKHLCALHKYIFQDIYEWAGKPREIDIFKHETVLAGISVDYTKYRNIKKETVAVIRGMKDESWKNLTLELQTEKFSKHLAALWKVHPFREGNTRTVTYFCCQYVCENGVMMDGEVFAKHSDYLRNALVAANAVFDDFRDRSKPEYLCRIVHDSIRRGQAQK